MKWKFGSAVTCINKLNYVVPTVHPTLKVGLMVCNI